MAAVLDIEIAVVISDRFKKRFPQVTTPMVLLGIECLPFKGFFNSSLINDNK